MAFVKWMKGIEYVSGALSKINKKSPHAADQTMLLATHRSAPTTNTAGCTRIYARTLENITRSTPVTADEITARNRFSAIVRAVAARRRNVSQMVTDRANFQAQKETGYKTIYQYLWHVCADAYDAQNNG